MYDDAISVLLIEDDARFQRSLAALFEDAGFHVHAAGSGEEGLTMLKSHAVDVCVVDMRLPKMDGNAFIERVIETHEGIGFIIHTGSVNYVPPPRLLTYGITPASVFLKPLPDGSVMVDEVKRLVGLKRQDNR